MRGSSVNITGLLGTAPIAVLKLYGVINWSWWWVTLPFWGPLVIVYGVVATRVALGASKALLVALVKR